MIKGKLERRRNAARRACLQESSGIIGPSRLVEIHCKKPAGVVHQEGIDANGMVSAQVSIDHVIGDEKKGIMRAVATLHSWLATDARLPFIRTGWGITCFTGLCILPTLWELIIPASKQRAKQSYLGGGTRCIGHWRVAGRRQAVGGEI